MLINRVGGGGENVTAEVNIQTPLVTDIAAILGAIAGRPAGTHLWAKFKSEGGDFIELAVSSEEDTYPNGAVANGYYYEKIFHVVCQDENGTYLLELAGAPESGDEPDVPGGDEPEVPVGPKKAYEYAVGDSVYLRVNGVNTEFIVVHQGTPSNEAQYANAHGTWLLSKQTYGDCSFYPGDDMNATYVNGEADNYLKNTFYNMLDASVKTLIKNATIPYHYSETNGTITRQVFALSYKETGIYGSITGSLSYFEDIDSQHSDKLVAYSSTTGQTSNWWLRDAYAYPVDDEDGSEYWISDAYFVGWNGAVSSEVPSSNFSVRPCMILDSNTEFDRDTNIIICE